jgi:hypothetical protein
MNCDRTIITKGMDYSTLVQLQTARGLAYTGASGGSVSAFLVDRKTASTINGNTVAQADSGSANWAAGIVEVVFSDTDTAALSTGIYQLQVDVTESDGTIRKVLMEQQYEVRSAT